MVVRNQKIVSEWSDMSIRRLLFQCFGLEQSGPHHHHLFEQASKLIFARIFGGVRSNTPDVANLKVA
jgi:hypothetical protein